MEIIMKRVEELTPYERNPRRNAEAVKFVVNSITQFGFRQPIIIDKDNVIVCGHTRLLAAKEMGYKEVPCIMADDLTPEQIKAYRLADNKTAEQAEWDIELLNTELLDLEANFDMSAFGFEFDTIPEESADDNFDVDSVLQDIETPAVKLGDIYRLGNHRLICGDSTDPETIARLMDGKLAHMCFTDPPWNVNYGASDHPSWKQRSIMNDSMSTEDFKVFLDKSFARVNEALLPGGMTYVVMSPQEWGSNMQALEEAGFHWSSTIIWNKDRIVLSRKDYHTKYEPIWYGWKEGEARLSPLEDRKQSDVWDFDRPSKSEEHPTMKPIPLVAKAITNSSKSRDLVIDLFGGSGTTMMASEQMERTCYMSELDPKYAEVIIRRFSKLFGKEDEVFRIENDGSETPWSDVQRQQGA